MVILRHRFAGILMVVLLLFILTHIHGAIAKDDWAARMIKKSKQGSKEYGDALRDSFKGRGSNAAVNDVRCGKGAVLVKGKCVCPKGTSYYELDSLSRITCATPPPPPDDNDVSRSDYHPIEIIWDSWNEAYKEQKMQQKSKSVLPSLFKKAAEPPAKNAPGGFNPNIGYWVSPESLKKPVSICIQECQAAPGGAHIPLNQREVECTAVCTAGARDVQPKAKPAAPLPKPVPQSSAVNAAPQDSAIARCVASLNQGIANAAQRGEPPTSINPQVICPEFVKCYDRYDLNPPKGLSSLGLGNARPGTKFVGSKCISK